LKGTTSICLLKGLKGWSRNHGVASFTFSTRKIS